MVRINRQVWLFCCLVAVWSLIGLVNAADRQISKNARYEIAYATYVGGDQWDQAREIIPYPDGSVLIGGMTSSSNMPTTPGVVQPRYAGDDPSLGHGRYENDGGHLFRRLEAGTRRLWYAAGFPGQHRHRQCHTICRHADNPRSLSDKVRWGRGGHVRSQAVCGYEEDIMVHLRRRVEK